ncbi:hypothetical protein ACHAAC_16705 [Aeromicrobium sp. CF4.19]|uniref:hypothetical protein n=1 Tax=Aeromicrobium sp. CF4.19 TaxID=3373082 RepID=UPI003EE66DA0
MALLGILAVQLPTPWSALGEVRSEPTAPMQSDRPGPDRTEPDVPEGWAPGSGARVVLPPDRQWTGT